MMLAKSVAAFLLCACSISAAEPDWPKVEQHAVAFLQRYVQVESVNPPADTRLAAELLTGEFAGAGLEAKTYPGGPYG